MTGRAAFLASLPRKRIAAGALIRDRQGAVCLVEPTYKELWHLPGGTVEADEAVVPRRPDLRSTSAA